MSIEVWLQHRPKGRTPYWACRVCDGDHVLWASRQVSVRLLSRDAALWIATMIAALNGPAPRLEWSGDLKDDCKSSFGEFSAHAEWLCGPRRGGRWYCSVNGPAGTRYFHTADQNDIQPRNADAARWLCELVIAAGAAGVIAVASNGNCKSSNAEADK